MKRTRVLYGESVFIGGRRCRISQSKGGGVNLYTDEDCPVVVGEASEVVDVREKLEPFAAAMDAAQPINVLRNRKVGA